ncbi:MAG: hypothetical protein SOZ42_00790 [Candidatus Enterosoma sp.]|nr:hypothetical protein [Candidatus Enterosoma sp.]
MKKLIKSLSVLSVSALYLVSSFSLFSCNKFVLSLPKIDSSSYKYEITSHLLILLLVLLLMERFSLLLMKRINSSSTPIIR